MPGAGTSVNNNLGNLLKSNLLKNLKDWGNWKKSKSY